MKRWIIEWAIGRPRTTIWLTVALTVVFLAMIPRIHIDTDPENMLPATEPVRVHHDEVKERFALSDYVVVGLVRESGIFTVDTMERVAALTETIESLDGVVAEDILAPTVVDDVYTDASGQLRVSPLMEEVPTSDAEAGAILERIRRNPMLRGKLASDDGQALAIYVPLEAKEHAQDVGDAIRARLDELGGDETVHLAGIPIAEDTFGIEMFKQMAIGAPAAFLLIFLLMLVFFRSWRLVLAPMIVSMMSVFWTMGLLIGLGFTVHIMSSMIPVFLIPIAVLDAIHILTEFHDKYPRHRDRDRALRETIDELFTPMAFTSITTMVGFASLTLTPIPPVQVFGAFVAFGVGTAWLLSMTFLVAYAKLMPESALEAPVRRDGNESGGLAAVRRLATSRAGALVGLAGLFLVVSVVGVTRIVVNDNPVNWFKASNPLRIADREMNAHLAGTYLTYLSFEGEVDEFKSPEMVSFIERLQRHLEQDDNVGGTTSVADVVTKVQREFLGEKAPDGLPTNTEEIAQYLFLYEIAGGDPDNLFKLISPEADGANVWVQLRRGENVDVARVVDRANAFVERERPRADLEHAWAGLPYINIVWQQKMVSGMGRALVGSFAIVLVMMSLLFRSVRLGLLSMVPLTTTILFVYGLIGWLGRPYDMPIAVLSSLSLGLSIDFAIHFVQRTREAFRERGSIDGALRDVFGAPTRAIVRNVVVIALGFVPMFFADLVPYVTVSVFFFLIMIISGVTTIVTLPAVLTLDRGRSL